MTQSTIKSMLHCYLVAGTQDCRYLPDYQISPQTALLNRLEQALRGGISCYQFREKERFALTDPKAIAVLARECQLLCQQYNVPFLINNDVKLALTLKADGINVGQSDRPIEHLVHETNGKMIIGLSASTLAQAQAHNNNININVHYYGCGPIFATQSKSDAVAAVGMNFIQTLRQNGITKPIVAIGGIKPEHAPALRQLGADGVAVVSTIMQANDVQETIKQLL